MAVFHSNYAASELKRQIEASSLTGITITIGQGLLVMKQQLIAPQIADVGSITAIAPNAYDVSAPTYSNGFYEITVTFHPQLGFGDEIHVEINGERFDIVISTNLVIPSDRRLVVCEVDPLSPDYGKLIGVHPKSELYGIKMPSMAITSSKPRTGLLSGESCYVQSTSQGLVWDGSNWRDVGPTPLLIFDTLKQLQSDTRSSVGTYALALDYGNLYVKATNSWKPLNTLKYDTYNSLMADTKQPDGTLAVVLDEDSFWEWDATTQQWICESYRPFSTMAAIQNWRPNDGAIATLTGKNIEFLRLSGEWQPLNTYIADTEAALRSDLSHINGQLAVAADTGYIFVFKTGSAGGEWVYSDIKSYDLEDDLLDTDDPNGTLAIAKDTFYLYYRARDCWIRANSRRSEVGSTFPVRPATTDTWVDTTKGNAPKIWIKDEWQSIATRYERAAGVPTTASLADREFGWIMEDTNDGRMYLHDKDRWLRLNESDRDEVYFNSGASSSAQFMFTLNPKPKFWLKAHFCVAPLDTSAIDHGYRGSAGVIAQNSGSWVNWNDVTLISGLRVDNNNNTQTLTWGNYAKSDTHWSDQTGGSLIPGDNPNYNEWIFVDVEWNKNSDHHAFMNVYVRYWSSNGFRSTKFRTIWNNDKLSDLNLIGIKNLTTHASTWIRAGTYWY